MCFFFGFQKDKDIIMLNILKKDAASFSNNIQFDKLKPGKYPIKKFSLRDSAYGGKRLVVDIDGGYLILPQKMTTHLKTEKAMNKLNNDRYIFVFKGKEKKPPHRIHFTFELNKSGSKMKANADQESESDDDDNDTDMDILDIDDTIEDDAELSGEDEIDLLESLNNAGKEDEEEEVIEMPEDEGEPSAAGPTTSAAANRRNRQASPKKSSPGKKRASKK